MAGLLARRAPYWHLHSGGVTQEAPGWALTARPGLHIAAWPVGQVTEQEPQLPTDGEAQAEPVLVCEGDGIDDWIVNRRLEVVGAVRDREDGTVEVVVPDGAAGWPSYQTSNVVTFAGIRVQEVQTINNG